MLRNTLLFVSILNIYSHFGTAQDETTTILPENPFELDYETVVRLANLPLTCYNTTYPYKFGNTVESVEDIQTPDEKHPIFGGCFDWHSAVHGHWLLANALNRFPDSELASNIIAVFDSQFQELKVHEELKVFEKDQHFERTYGWAWYLKLILELEKNPLNEAHKWSQNLKPIADKIIELTKGYLPDLVYPLRVGTHTNLAFGLIFIMEYAEGVNDQELLNLIKYNSTSHYGLDVNCPIDWEPSGSDFFSPCLQEAELMSKVVDSQFFESQWLQGFLPQLLEEDFVLEPGQVLDATDGHLVHLHGLNFSRAWNLYALYKLISEDSVKERLLQIADDHILASMDEVVDSSYEGSHWLATFLFYALEQRESLNL